MAAATDAANGISTHRIFGIDSMDLGSMTQQKDPEISFPVKLERVGIDLDEMQVPLSGYKVISKIIPQVTTTNSDKDFKFTFGAANLSSDAPSYSTTQTLNISTDYKLDSRASGRYLSYKFEESTTVKDFSLSGFDFEVAVTGRR
jgi:hypothetical protein